MIPFEFPSTIPNKITLIGRETMEHIINYIHANNWKEINNCIKNNDQINWDQIVDQTNGLIHYLAYHGKINLIKNIEPDIFQELVSQENTEGDTICHIAAKLNQKNLFDFVLKTKPEIIYSRNQAGFTPLYYLVPNISQTKKLLKSFELVDHFISPEYTLSEYYILSGNLDMAFHILDNIKLNELSKHAVFTTIDSELDTDFKIELIQKLFELPILVPSISNSTEPLESVSGSNKYRIDPNSLNEKFISPLIRATETKNIKLAKFLLDMGADPDYSGPESNNNPLSIAIKNNDPKFVELLIEFGANPNITDKYLRTPVHYLFDNKYKFSTKLKRKLLEKMDDVNITDNQMNTVLSLLVSNDKWKRYEDILEEYKLKVHLKNKDGIAPIDKIKKEDFRDFIHLVYRSYLNQLNYDINWVDTVDKKISLMLENGDDIGSFRDYIIRKIIGGQSYPLIKNNNMIRMITTPHTNITYFSAYIYNYICFLYYLLKKYPEMKIPSLAPDQMKKKKLNDLYQEMTEDFHSDFPDDQIFRSMIRDYISHSPVLINHVIIWKDAQNYFVSPYIIQGINETLQKYPDTKFILMKLTIVGEKNFNHANLIIFDIKRKIVERFDPYGNVSFIDNLEINNFLKTFFQDHFPNIKYISPGDVCNGVSFQIISDEYNDYVENDPVGFCVAWCLWYAEMRIKNEKISPKSLIRRTIYQINKTQQTFKDYIRDYANYLDHEKNQILEKAGIPEKYWYRHKLPMIYYKSYLKNIRKNYSEII